MPAGGCPWRSRRCWLLRESSIPFWCSAVATATTTPVPEAHIARRELSPEQPDQAAERRTPHVRERVEEHVPPLPVSLRRRQAGGHRDCAHPSDRSSPRCRRASGGCGAPRCWRPTRRQGRYVSAGLGRFSDRGMEQIACPRPHENACIPTRLRFFASGRSPSPAATDSRKGFRRRGRISVGGVSPCLVRPRSVRVKG